MTEVSRMRRLTLLVSAVVLKMPKDLQAELGAHIRTTPTCRSFVRSTDPPARQAREATRCRSTSVLAVVAI